MTAWGGGDSRGFAPGATGKKGGEKFMLFSDHNRSTPKAAAQRFGGSRYSNQECIVNSREECIVNSKEECIVNSQEECIVTSN